MSTYQDTQNAQIEESGAALVALCDKLAAAGATSATANWWGAGDEGSVQEGALFTTVDGKEVALDLDDLTDEFILAVEAHLEARYGGWYNEDGGGGHIEVNVVDRTFEITHGWNVEHQTTVTVTAPAQVEQPLEAIQKDMNAAYAEAAELRKRAEMIEALWSGALLLEIADKYPEGAIRGYWFETESVYNDQGGYFDTVRVVADTDEVKAGDADPEDDHDLMGTFSPDGITALFGKLGDLDPIGEEIVMSLDQLRTRVQALRTQTS